MYPSGLKKIQEKLLKAFDFRIYCLNKILLIIFDLLILKFNFLGLILEYNL